MPEHQQRKVQGEHSRSDHMSGQHRQHLHNPTGYTDEVADEEREFMMQAERSAGQSQGNESSSRSAGENMKTMKGGLGSQQQQGSNMGSNIGQQAGSTMENIKNKAKDTMNM